MGADRERVGEDTLALLDDEVQCLVAAYPREPLSAIRDDLLETHDQVFRLLEGGRVRPSQLRDLYVKGAVLSFLVAKGFNDMEVPLQAMTMTRVAAACARDAEHPGLIALTDGLKSLIAYWADKPADAYHYASQGAETAANLRGTVGLWLLGLKARAAAVLGDEETVRTTNQQAQDRRERVVLDDLDQLVACSPTPRRSSCTTQSRRRRSLATATGTWPSRRNRPCSASATATPRTGRSVTSRARSATWRSSGCTAAMWTVLRRPSVPCWTCRHPTATTASSCPPCGSGTPWWPAPRGQVPWARICARRSRCIRPAGLRCPEGRVRGHVPDQSYQCTSRPAGTHR